MDAKVQWFEYTSNNSGGRWWLKDDDWKRLEKAGWIVDWRVGPDSKVLRWLGALATRAYKQFPDEDAAKADWREIVGQDPDEGGCRCCDQPHFFAPFPKGR